MENNDIYSTRDLALAAALVITHKLHSVDKNDPKRVYFLFDNSPELQEQIQRYYNKELTVDALTYANETKNLKRIIYEQTPYERKLTYGRE